MLMFLMSMPRAPALLTAIISALKTTGNMAASVLWLVVSTLATDRSIRIIVLLMAAAVATVLSRSGAAVAGAGAFVVVDRKVIAVVGGTAG